MTSVKDLLATANAAVPKLTPAQAKEMIAKGGATVLDVRDGTEVAQSGKIKDAVHVARGSLEFRADPESASHVKSLSKDQPVLLYCGSGGRAALAGKTLRDMGYTKVFNVGGFKELADGGLEVEKG
jgi:rhodanese-related sulfurtransferase